VHLLSRPARRDRFRRNRRGCHSSPGMLTPIEYELRGSQIQPVARPESSNPGSANPGHTSPGPGEAQALAAGAGKSGSYLGDLTSPSVVQGGQGNSSAFSVILSSGTWQAARVLAACSALLSCISGRGCLCREPARPARRRSRRGALRPGDRRGDRGGQAPQAPGRHPPDARVACSRRLPGRCAEAASGAAAPGLAPWARARCSCRWWWYRRCHGLG
jgi:hypothetical protein